MGSGQEKFVTVAAGLLLRITTPELFFHFPREFRIKISWNSVKPWSCTLLCDTAHWPQTVFCSPLCLHLSCFNSARPWSQLSSCMAVVYWNRLTQTEFYLGFFLHKIFCSSRKLPTHYFLWLRWQYTDISPSGCLMHSSTAFQDFFFLKYLQLSPGHKGSWRLDFLLHFASLTVHAGLFIQKDLQQMWSLSLASVTSPLYTFI